MSNANPLKIAFLTHRDPLNRRSFSGTLYYMGQALVRNGFDVSFIGPIKPWEEFIGKVINRTAKVLLKKQFIYTHSLYISRRYARIAEKRMKNKPFDFIFAASASTEIAFLKTNIPIVYTADTSWKLLHNYYPTFSNILKTSEKSFPKITARAIQRSEFLIYPSVWAADSAVNDFGGDRKKVSIVPWGANMDVVPTREQALNHPLTDKCRLLFLGVDWYRKGGAIAYETLLELEKAGVNATLTICGCVPPEPINHPRVTVIPFLSKNDPAQRKELENLFLQSDFFLLPTRAECYGIVFSEASGYGLPIIATNTGGVNGVVKEGVNGFLLPESAGGKEYAEVIKKIYNDEKKYDALVKSSRKHYEEEINWDTWAQRVKKTLTDYIESHKN